MKEKIAFETYGQAREELERIVNTNHKPWKTINNKKPIRWYEEKGLFYLTSQPLIKIY